ncbi:diguanylate cyclase [Candidatus Magnetaquicoccus inordinatus]|uniref:diguanylate cyclase n=1 Tax=Candidatus Magnetaquicoccus inordinatus TaxID=2496818 RepID=UPI00102C2D37|nr:diguanylate cyclase [Candidatus Magnetaquicoccus inordinatus]
MKERDPAHATAEWVIGSRHSGGKKVSQALAPEQLDHAIALAPHIWWVGHRLPGDPFQCHSYLIEWGDQSVLLDPGSPLTFPETLRKVQEVIPLAQVRTIICHHQDPDITAILPHLDRVILRPDAQILSHWRAITLLKHLGLRRLPFRCVEQMGWQLDLGGRLLQFIFTPYLHFPGAFCTFDVSSGILFSSDIFGGLSADAALFAQDESCFESIRTFHEHYMPSRDILAHGMSNLEQLPLRLLAPQHGSLIPEPLISFVINQLKGLDCGLFLLTHTNSDYRRLSQLNRMLREMMQTIMVYRDFAEVVERILELAAPLLPVVGLEFYTQMESGEPLHMAPESRFHGVRATPPQACHGLLGMSRQQWWQRCTGHVHALAAGALEIPGETQQIHGLVLPLFSSQTDMVRSLAILRLTEAVILDEELIRIVDQLSLPLGVAVERESLLRVMDAERQQAYERSIRDALTGLYTRHYMQEALVRLCQIHNRDPEATIAVAAFDVDHFKSVNDQFGHGMGDQVLRRVARVLVDNSRSVDLPVRLGGEELVLFIIGATREIAVTITERIRARIEQLQFEAPMQERQVTISGGVAFRTVQEPIEHVMERADMALYQAKKGGRNRIVISN